MQRKLDLALNASTFSDLLAISSFSIGDGRLTVFQYTRMTLGAA